MSLNLRGKVWTRDINLRVIHTKMSLLQKMMTSVRDKIKVEERWSSGELYRTPTSRSGQGGGGSRGHWQRTVQRRRKANTEWGPNSPNSWKVKVDEHTGSSHMESSVILAGTFLASYICTSTLPNFHLQYRERTCIFQGQCAVGEILTSESWD